MWKKKKKFEAKLNEMDDQDAFFHQKSLFGLSVEVMIPFIGLKYFDIVAEVYINRMKTIFECMYF